MSSHARYVPDSYAATADYHTLDVDERTMMVQRVLPR